MEEREDGETRTYAIIGRWRHVLLLSAAEVGWGRGGRCWLGAALGILATLLTIVASSISMSSSMITPASVAYHHLAGTVWTFDEASKISVRLRHCGYRP